METTACRGGQSGVSLAASASLFVVAGAAGVGKTTFGRALALARGAALLDQDSLTNPLMMQLSELAGSAGDLDHAALRGTVRRARYRCLLDVAIDNIRLGQPVVLVAPFTSEVRSSQEWVGAFAGFAPAPVTLVWVDVPAETARSRRRQRGLPRDLAARLDGPATPSTRPAVPHIAVDGTAPTAGGVERVLRLCGTGGTT